MYFIKLVLIMMSLYFTVNMALWAETMTNGYEEGLLLRFIPNGDTESLDEIIYKNTTFIGDNSKENENFANYSEMPHWLNWQGFYNAEQTGQYIFFLRGNSSYDGCEFEVKLANKILFKGKLRSSFDRKKLNLGEGIHKFEVKMSCRHYNNANAVIEIKRPGERGISKIKTSELLYPK